MSVVEYGGLDNIIVTEDREQFTSEQLKNAAARILMSYKYEKVNGLGCAEVVINAGVVPATNHKRIQVINKDTGVVFDTIKAAADSIRMDSSAFARKLKRKRFKQFDYYGKEKV